MEALNQILEMLGTQKEKSSNEPASPTGFTTGSPGVTSTTLLDSVHQQFLAGCFGLGILNTDITNNTQLYHYQVRLCDYHLQMFFSQQMLMCYWLVSFDLLLQDGIKAANYTTQQAIQVVVHKIYENLVAALVENTEEEYGHGKGKCLNIWAGYQITNLRQL